MKRVSSIILVISIVFVGCYSLWVSKTYTPFNNLVDTADTIVTSALIDIEPLTQIAENISFISGNIKKNGVYITKHYLLEDIQNTQPEVTEKNIEKIQELLGSFVQSTYLMLIPTSSVIKQQELPSHVSGLYNQKNFISSVYSECKPVSSTIDIYSNLFAAKEHYTYYRNSSGLTSLGGYYIYQSAAGKLGFSPRSLDEFEVEHLQSNYYGDLSEKTEFYSLDPDIVTMHKFKRYPRRYMITQHDYNGIQKNYYSLFPNHLRTNPNKAILGGMSKRIDIVASSPYQESCLIIGDETALSYIPFLMVHYGQITFIDINEADLELEKIETLLYDQVIVGLSTKTLLNNDLNS